MSIKLFAKRTLKPTNSVNTIQIFKRNVYGRLTSVNPLPDDTSNADASINPLILPSLEFPVDSGINVNLIASALSNFKEAKSFYRQKVLEGNRELPNIYNGSSSMQNVFRSIFPELVNSRRITMLEQQDRSGALFSRWKEGNNEVTIELSERTSSDVNNEHMDAIFVGGPSTLTACLLYQLRYPDHKVRHFVTNRYDSNHDGSAYYYHQRDAAPVYINRVNRGPYCIYIDLYKRLISAEKLASEAETNRHHVKISLSWANFKARYLFTIFLPNFWHMVTDLWIKEKKNTKISHVVTHASRTIQIVHQISQCTGMPVESMLIHGKNKANYAEFVGAKKSPKAHFIWLNKFAHIPFHEISCEGFGNDVTQVLNFPNDGLVSPMIIDNLHRQIKDQSLHAETSESHKVVQDNTQLKKLFVQQLPSDSSNHLRVTGVEWIDMTNGTIHRTKVDRVFLSMGPSGQIKIVSPKLTWFQHVFQLVKRQSTSSTMSINYNGGYKPTIASLWRHTLNTFSNRFFRGAYCLKDTMWASGSSSVILLGVDTNRMTPAQLDVLTRFIDGVNQHWTLIAQRDVSLPMISDPQSPMKTYRFFAIQATGGGNFPSRLIRPDYLLNLLYTTEKMYGLDTCDHAMYDLVQSRGCGRSVSAQNTIAIQALTSNAVINYALGGIGMSTMFPNGEKMVQMVEKKDITLKELPKDSTWSQNLLDDIDYSFMVEETSQVARRLGYDNSMSKNEKTVLAGSSVIVFCILIFAIWYHNE